MRYTRILYRMIAVASVCLGAYLIPWVGLGRFILGALWVGIGVCFWHGFNPLKDSISVKVHEILLGKPKSNMRDDLKDAMNELDKMVGKADIKEDIKEEK